MPTIILETKINAPPDACFDLVRDPRIHTATTIRTNIKAGVADGMIGLGQTVTFDGTHFGIRQRLTVEVVEFERPRLFVDEMTEGMFKSFRHVHEFIDKDGETLMRDTFIWESPFGILGRIADTLFIEPHLRNLASTRNSRLKQIAEASASK